MLELAPVFNVAYPVEANVAELPGWLALGAPVADPYLRAEFERASAFDCALSAPLREPDILDYM